jgi:hypothetical protein
MIISQTSQTIGHVEPQSSERCEYLKLAFSPLNAPLRTRWRNNGLSADFLGDYVSTFLPALGSDATADVYRVEIKHAVTYIANELLENAMKYHERDVDIPIGICLELNSDSIKVSASNGIGAKQAELYRAFVAGMLQGDPGDMLFRQIEQNAEDAESNTSALGLLTMINDYGTQLGWHFAVHPENSAVMTVTTSATLSIKNLAKMPK